MSRRFFPHIGARGSSLWLSTTYLADAESPLTITCGEQVTYVLPDGSKHFGFQLSSSAAIFDGSLKAIQIRGISKPLDITCTNTALSGVLDLSSIEIESLTLNPGQNISSITWPENQTAPFVKFYGEDYTGEPRHLDFSAMPNLSGRFELLDNFLSFSHTGANPGLVDYFSIQTPDGTKITNTTLDLTAFSNLGGEFRLSRLDNIQTLVLAGNTNVFTHFSIGHNAPGKKMALSGALDLHALFPNITNTLKVFRTNLTSLSVPAGPYSSLDAHTNALTSITWNGTTLSPGAYLYLYSNQLANIDVGTLPYVAGMDLRIYGNGALVTGPAELRSYSHFYIGTGNLTPEPALTNVVADDLRMHGMQVTGPVYAAGGNQGTTFYIGNHDVAVTHVPVIGVDIIYRNIYSRSAGYSQEKVNKEIDDAYDNIIGAMTGTKVLYLGNQGVGLNNAAPSADRQTKIDALVADGWIVTVWDGVSANITYAP